MASDAHITVSAPGSLMLLGEHAVLRGRRALVCAIDRRVVIELTPLSDDSVEIESALGSYKAPLSEMVEHPSLTFMLKAVERYRETAPSGFKLQVESDFSADIGFGSSSAVTVATHAALMEWISGGEWEKEALFRAALETVRAVQGRGSGADLAAAVFGGATAYTTAPSFEPVQIAAPLTAVYCGYKTPTPEVIGIVDRAREKNPAEFEALFSEIDASVTAAVEHLRAGDLSGFGGILNRNNEIMDAMGVNTPELAEIVAALRAEPSVFGAKISGSGLGDCAVGLGHAELADSKYEPLHLNISPTGALVHE